MVSTMIEDVFTYTDDVRRFIGRVESLPVLAKRAADVDRDRSIPEETIRDLQDAGVLRMLTPRLWGGLGFELAEYQDMCRRLAHGCGSTAWVAGYLVQHAWMLARWPLDVQRAIFEADPDAKLASSNAGGGELTPTAGGYRLSGRWAFVSGVMHADHVFVGVHDGNELVQALLTVDQVEIVDTWQTAGLRGTASNDIRIDDAFVPADHVLPWRELGAIDNPGAAVHPEPLLRSGISSVFNTVAPAVILGSVEAAAADFRQLVETRKVKHAVEERQALSPLAQARVARIDVELLSARLLWREATDVSTNAYRAGRGLTIDERARYRLALQQLHGAAGSNQQRLSVRLQRIERDVNVLSTHATVVEDPILEQAGRALLGQGSTVPEEFF